ncbi:hypothetical protein Tco_1419478 [Tanacetum coccineum]
MALSLGDPGSFLIPCTFANSVECLALADVGASINLMPYSFKELNLGVGDDRITFLIDKVLQHSHSNDDTCFYMDVIDEVTKEELYALLDDSEPFLNTPEKINKTSLDKEFEEFMVIDVEEIPEQEEEIDDKFEELPLEENLRINTSIQYPPTDLESKPLPKHLEYDFLEKDSLLPLGISALLKDDEKKHLVSVLKNHKEAFAWKTSDIPGIRPSFCKHKIYFEDDTKPVIQRQRRPNPNMKEVVKKEIIKLLDAGIIYPIKDSSWPNLEELRDEDINDNFHDETLMNISTNDNKEIPWFAYFANYLVGKILRKGLTYAQRCKFFSNLKHYFWGEPCLFKMYPDGMIRRCDYSSETQKLLDACYHGPTGGHYGPSTTAKKLDDALRAFRTAYKTPIGTTPYWLLYGKTCHLPLEIEHRVYWALRSSNLDLKIVGEKRFLQLHELDELRLQAYENFKHYKARTKAYHDKKLRIRKEFKAGDKVLLFNSKYKFNAPKLRYKWYGLFIVKHGFPSDMLSYTTNTEEVLLLMDTD